MDTIRRWVQELEAVRLSADILLTLGAILVFVVLLKLMQVWFRRGRDKVRSWEGTRIRTLRIQSQEIIPAGSMVAILIGIVRLLHILAVIIATYAVVDFIFSLYAPTSGFARALLDRVGSSMHAAGASLIDYLPNLAIILVIVFLTIQVNRIVGILFAGVSEGRIHLGGFYPEWAGTTAKILRFLIFVFSAIMIFPYLPGSGSGAFQGVSIFIGVIISLGSTAAIANVVAGVVLTYTRAFKVGDYVRIADTSGEVTERSLFVTNIRTLKNEDTSIPNAMVLANHIVNYSKQADGHGLILHTTVTIGYDVPWRQVHELLLTAAGSVEELEKTPAPFVLQTALSDFYVAYELNAATRRPELMPRTYSLLHQAIQDSFFAAGVEIMSPHFSALRDGNATAIPEGQAPGDQPARAFRVHIPGTLPESYRPDRPGRTGGGEQPG